MGGWVHAHARHSAVDAVLNGGRLLQHGKTNSPQCIAHCRPSQHPNPCLQTPPTWGVSSTGKRCSLPSAVRTTLPSTTGDLRASACA